MVVFHYFNKKLAIVIAAWALLFVTPAHAEPMFEGYYKIISAGVPVGFVIQRFDFDKASKVFTSVYYIKTNKFGGNITEGLTAKANDKFEPLSYEYTSQVGKQIKIISAKFAGKTMNLTLSDGKKSRTYNKKMPADAFLSTFLAYKMLSQGLSAGKKYTYKAVAEEDGEIFAGEAFVQKEIVEKGIKAFRILNNFKNAKFISRMTDKAHVLGTKSPLNHIETQLVARPAQATQGFMLDTKSLKVLFNRIPSGKFNPLSQRGKLPEKKAANK